MLSSTYVMMDNIDLPQCTIMGNVCKETYRMSLLGRCSTCRIITKQPNKYASLVINRFESLGLFLLLFPYFLKAIRLLGLRLFMELLLGTYKFLVWC